MSKKSQTSVSAPFSIYDTFTLLTMYISLIIYTFNYLLLYTGGMVKILLDTHHLHRTAQHLELPQIAVQDILQELDSRLSTVSKNL